MPKYVDGFIIPIAKKNLAAYPRLARLAAKVWKEHGALEYRECVGEDLQTKFGTPFTRLARARKNETVIFSWITFKSRAHRDKVNAKAMKDPRLAPMMDPKNVPFDNRRMSYGGFKMIVEK
ncbi:MAG TPA: DUF1428 domain-containing protein [Verrucomicrobiales bacterium]|nr:DUF1428 domain-containing protein [Verrucomicrobiales bacterium]